MFPTFTSNRASAISANMHAAVQVFFRGDMYAGDFFNLTGFLVDQE